MDTAAEVSKILASGAPDAPAFERQLRDFEEFSNKMAAAGAAIQKQTFRIPLMERIGLSSVRSSVYRLTEK